MNDLETLRKEAKFWLKLYRLLLERGAEPYDIQVLYNTHFRGDVLWWLTLTWEYSIASGRRQDWADPDLPMFDMGGYGTGARFLLWLAIQKNNHTLAAWLLERGANPNAPPPRAPNLPGRRNTRRPLSDSPVITTIAR